MKEENGAVIVNTRLRSFPGIKKTFAHKHDVHMRTLVLMSRACLTSFVQSSAMKSSVCAQLSILRCQQNKMKKRYSKMIKRGFSNPSPVLHSPSIKPCT